uniref:Protein phosphatase n=1 Tax=Helicotheca tamesis TaxID=374047 RepID=A0A7S2GZ76_9STRA|mmetsp:Transcript_13581/g.18633  ORF Transcript_13581/g.18633 Transcript_13581/m.18633 type:complete len:507 (+) Transcript_13581:168-1688(+)
MKFYQCAILSILAQSSVKAFTSPPLKHLSNTQQQIASLNPKQRTTTIPLYGSLDPLASEGEWTAYLDEDSTGLVYYFNGETGESMWEPPTDTFPAVKLSADKRRIARERRKIYEASFATPAEEEVVEEAEQQTASGGGFFGFGGGGRSASEAVVAEEEAVVVAEEEIAEVETKSSTGGGGGFFASVFGGGSKKETINGAGVEEPAVVEEEPVMEEAIEETAEEDAVPARKMGFGFPDIFNTGNANEEDVLGEDLIIPADKPIKIEANFQVLPHPAKVSWGGEDATFLKGRTFGVFDGVSGADKLSGVALYSKTLASYMRKLVGNEGLSIDELIGFLTSAAEYADIGATGASTAVVASVGEDGFLRALNLGDSVLLVLRDGKVAARTKEIVHYFDCPYQLAEDSPDRPVDSTLLKTRVYPGDVIITGSDGVFDNLDDDQIIKIVGSCPEKSSAIARKIIEQSRIVSLDEEALTPYAKSARGRRGYDEYANGRGGKVDDISCVVVRCT